MVSVMYMVKNDIPFEGYEWRKHAIFTKTFL
jgi:hypothetical protein